MQKWLSNSLASFWCPKRCNPVTSSFFNISNVGISASNNKQHILFACFVDFKLNLMIKLINFFFCINGWTINLNDHYIKGCPQSQCSWVIDCIVIRYCCSYTHSNYKSNIVPSFFCFQKRVYSDLTCLVSVYFNSLMPKVLIYRCFISFFTVLCFPMLMPPLFHAPTVILPLPVWRNQPLDVLKALI